MIINGCYELQLRVLGRNITGTFFILPDLTQDLILGIDLIRKFGRNFQAKAGLVTINRDPEAEESDIFVRNRMVIPADCSALIRVRVPQESLLWTEGAVVAEFSSRRST